MVRIPNLFRSKTGLRLLTGVALLACFCTPPWQRTNGFIDRNDLPLNITPLRGGVWLIQDFNYYPTNQVMYIDPDEGAVFVDATWTYKGARQILWKAAANTRGDFLAVVLTGFPLFRTGGLDPFATHRMAILMQRQTPRLMRENWDLLQDEMLRSFSSWRRFDPVPATVLFDRSVGLLEDRVHLYHFGPAFTPDSVIVHFPQERVIYAGSVLSDPPVFMDHAVLDGYDHVLDEIEKLDFDLIVSGHGEPLRDRTFVETVRERVRRLRTRG